jgi:hypothetical protein
MFPALYAMTVHGVVDGAVKRRVNHDVAVGSTVDAQIIAFAQQETVWTFIAGVNPAYDAALRGYLVQLFETYPRIVVECIAEMDDHERALLQETLLEQGKVMLDQLEQNLVQYRHREFIDPVLAVVGGLPKNELAELAESLVHLTSLKRRISMDDETVGGPIDVAVISKGDGFVWIKRKRYFDPELNYRFFANYFRGG